MLVSIFITPIILFLMHQLYKYGCHKEKYPKVNLDKMNGKVIKFCVWGYTVCIVIIMPLGLLASLILFSIWKIYENSYYKSIKFKIIKKELSDYVTNCHELNEHIEELKNSYSGIEKKNYGRAEIEDNSRYNYKGAKQVDQKSKFTYDCSIAIYRAAEQQPFKYLCKYFNIDSTEESLEKFEDLLNKFSAAEEGKVVLNNELERIKRSLKNRKDIPFLINFLGMEKFIKEIGIIQRVDFNDLYFPVYTFRYRSPGGNKSSLCNIKLDIENLNEFVEYLSELVNFRKSVAGQRALMTSKLRESIKQRDNYTCKQCGLSTYDEPNLLLEIDHIVPISKGGLSTEENLQTLCWKCNRTKGAKLVS